MKRVLGMLACSGAAALLGGCTTFTSYDRTAAEMLSISSPYEQRSYVEMQYSKKKITESEYKYLSTIAEGSIRRQQEEEKLVASMSPKDQLMYRKQQEMMDLQRQQIDLQRQQISATERAASLQMLNSSSQNRYNPAQDAINANEKFRRDFPPITAPTPSPWVW